MEEATTNQSYPSVWNQSQIVLEIGENLLACLTTSSQPCRYFKRFWLYCMIPIYSLKLKMTAYRESQKPPKSESLQHCLPAFLTMSKIFTAVLATASVNRRSGGRRLIPRRGQIKSRIAATALHSITSMLLRALPRLPHHKWCVLCVTLLGRHLSFGICFLLCWWCKWSMIKFYMKPVIRSCAWGCILFVLWIFVPWTKSWSASELWSTSKLAVEVELTSLQTTKKKSTQVSIQLLLFLEDMDFLSNLKKDNQHHIKRPWKQPSPKKEQEKKFFLHTYLMKTQPHNCQRNRSNQKVIICS